MNIDELKSSWQNAGTESLTEKDLERMTKLTNHPTLRNIRRKLLLEISSMSILLFVYYDAFDGYKKPFYVNLLLTGCLFIYISGNLAGYFLIKNPVHGRNLKQSVQTLFRRVKGIFIFSIFSSLLYSVTLLLFFSSTIVFTQSKYVVVAALSLSFTFLFYHSFKKWKMKLDHYKKLAEDFE